jgi:hypothetical protein
MSGWSVFHARRTKMIERYRRNDDFHKYEELTEDINFLSAMRMYKSEAALSDHYLEKCYHDSIRTSDRGRMTEFHGELATRTVVVQTSTRARPRPLNTPCFQNG